MRICRFNGDRLGLVKGDRVYDVTAHFDGHLHAAWPLPQQDLMIASLGDVSDRLARLHVLASDGMAIDAVSLNSPVANPPKIVAAPVNYYAHIDESEADVEITGNRPVLRIGEAGLFLKATSSLVGPSEGIAVHFPHRRTDHEVELAVVIGRRASNISERDALDVVAGYCIGLDITIRGPEDRSFRKSLDSYTVLGPWLTTADEIADPDNLHLDLRVNGEVRQDANTRQLIFGVRKLIAWASEWYVLNPGDVLLTGTPEGVGRIRPGDIIDASIERLGSIRVAVRAESALSPDVTTLSAT